MPTAGEARLKSKSLNKTPKDGASIRGKATAVKSSTNKIGEVKRKTVPRPNSGKSSIPVPVKRGAKGKENADPKVDPTVQSKNTFSKVKQAPDFRKVKQAPDFRKVHRKWQDQLSKGKAVAKKKNTTVEPFRLAENSQKTDKKSYAYNSDDDDDNDSEDDDFEIDSTALKGILNNTGIKNEDLRFAGRATIAAIPSSKSEQARNSIYFTRPPTQHAAGAPSSSVSKLWCTPSTTQVVVSPLKPRNVDFAPARSQAVSSAKKQVAWADEVSENDVFDFQPDSQALQSILSNSGINFDQMRVQNTSRVTLAGGRLTPYRRPRQSFREEPSKRTSIYYTGPRRMRPSPKVCGMGRPSVLGTSVGARQLTAGPAVNSQQTSAYDPFATMVGRQGNQQQENEPVVNLEVGQFTTRKPEPVFQSTSNNPLLTPAQELVSSAQSFSARDQPSWAEILTPQRGASTQFSAVQTTRSQSSLEPLRTPAKQQQPLQADICTPQRITGIQNAAIAQGPVRSTTSARQPLVDWTQQHGASDIFTPQHSFSNTRQQLTTQTVNFQRHHVSMATPSRQPQTGSQASRSELPPECRHVQAATFQPPVRTLAIPARQGPAVFQSFSSDQPPPWSEIFTPQRGSRQCSTVTVNSFNDPLATPVRQSLSVTQGSCSTQQPPIAHIFTPQQGGDTGTIQDLGPRLQCSTVQVTSFQPSVVTTQGSCSVEEFLTPREKDGVQKEHYRLTTVEEEDDIARLERQALEDLGFLKITELPVTTEKTNLRPVSTYRSAGGASEQLTSSCNTTWTSTKQQSRSSFSPVVPFTTGANVRNTLQSSCPNEGGREWVNSGDVSAIPFNSTPLFYHRDLFDNSASRLDEASTYSGLHQNSPFIKYSRINQTPCIAPTPVKVSHSSASGTTYREPPVTSVSRLTSPVQPKEEALSKERGDDRPIQVVSPTPKVRNYKHVPSDNRSLSLRSAVLSTNTTTTEDATAFSGEANTRFHWEPSGPEVVPSAFRPTASASRAIPKTLAKEALLDMEVSVYMTAGHGRVVTPRDWNHRPMNPLAKVFAEGDSVHFLPIINRNESVNHYM